MEDSLIFERETLTIEGDRNLYNYTFREATPLDRIAAMILSGELGVVGPFLDRHPEADLAQALELARRQENEEAVREIEARTGGR